MFCKHEWKVLSETTTQSALENAFQAAKNANLNLESFKGFSAERKHIQVFTCTLCGKFKRFVETI